MRHLDRASMTKGKRPPKIRDFLKLRVHWPFLNAFGLLWQAESFPYPCTCDGVLSQLMCN
eukprot:1161353-Pelagomonas_calceolata.AAC.11